MVLSLLEPNREEFAVHTKVDQSSAYISEQQRETVPENRLGLSGIDHVGLLCADAERAGKFVERILGGVEIYRAGCTPEDRKLGRTAHIFFHVGAQLIEVVETPKGHRDASQDAAGISPHWAFGTTPAKLATFMEHLKAENIPFDGPRSHAGVSVVSVYFRDCDGNNLEVTTWNQFDPGLMSTRLMSKEYGFVPWPSLLHDWQP
jgi:catechol 2,3-dioxygenase-like lactoylglutathione lyase family enzyme